MQKVDNLFKLVHRAHLHITKKKVEKKTNYVFHLNTKFIVILFTNLCIRLSLKTLGYSSSIFFLYENRLIESYHTIIQILIYKHS